MAAKSDGRRIDNSASVRRASTTREPLHGPIPGRAKIEGILLWRDGNCTMSVQAKLLFRFLPMRVLCKRLNSSETRAGGEAGASASSPVVLFLSEPEAATASEDGRRSHIIEGGRP